MHSRNVNYYGHEMEEKIACVYNCQSKHAIPKDKFCLFAIQQYEERMCGAFFARFAQAHLPNAFAASVNPRAKRMLQDGCPCQNSGEARDAMDRMGVKLLPIPARSPDLNPIENLFAQVKVG